MDEELSIALNNNNLIKNNDYTDPEYTFYEFTFKNNLQFTQIYVQVNNQITNKKKSYKDNFILDNLKHEIFYTNTIDNIERASNNEYKLNKKYVENFSTNMNKSLILIKNPTISIIEKTDLNVITELDIENLPDDNKFNLFLNSDNKELLNFDSNMIDPFFFYFRNTIFENELYQDFSDIKLQATLNTPLDGILVDFEEGKFTKNQFDRIKNINREEYKEFHEGANYIVSLFLDNYYTEILLNYDKELNSMEDIDFKIQFKLNEKFPAKQFVYDRNIGITIAGHQNYNDIHLSISIDENNKFIQTFYPIGREKLKLFTFKEFLQKVQNFLTLAKQTKTEIFEYVKNNKIENFNLLDILKKLQYSKYCLDKDYNPDYIENNNDKIFKFKLELNLIDDAYELFINNTNIQYYYFDDKNIFFYYNEPSNCNKFRIEKEI